MLAFKMKKPQQSMGLERQLKTKIDVERWGPEGLDLVSKLDGMRVRMKEASQSFSEKGASECREVFGRYQALVFQGDVVCRGLDMKALQLGFKWGDAFEPDTHTTEHDWTFERACVIFNLAASISFLATHSDRQTPDGLKTACGLYQQAAGALAAVQALVKEGAWRASADLSSDTLHVLQTLMLAQAQKCFFEKAERESMSTKVLAKLTAECASLYSEVARSIAEAKQRARPISAMPSDWLDVVQWNRHLFDGLQHYYLGRLHEEAHEYGKALARVTHATNQCALAVNGCAQSNPALQDFFRRHHTVCAEAQARQKKDNDLVHYEKVPDVATLPTPERHCMLDVSDPDAAATAALVQQLSMGGGGGGSGGGGAPPPSFATAEEAGVRELTAMGFAEPKARAALQKTGGSVQVATELLLAES